MRLRRLSNLTARAALGSALALGTTLALASSLTSGVWQIEAGRDRFTGAAKVIAVTGGFAVRCLDDIVTLGLVEPLPVFQPGEAIGILFRADQSDVVNMFGAAVSATAIVIVAKPGMLKRIAAAREIALRVTTHAGRFDRVFKAAGGAEAMAIVQHGCPNDE